MAQVGAIPFPHQQERYIAVTWDAEKETAEVVPRRPEPHTETPHEPDDVEVTCQGQEAKEYVPGPKSRKAESTRMASKFVSLPNITRDISDT